MRRFVLRRAAYAALSLFLLSVTIFLFVRVTGDPTVSRYVAAKPRISGKG